MTRRDNRDRRLRRFPSDIRGAHTHSSKHRDEVFRSTLCSGFYFCRTFPPTDIREWIDGNQTARCPRCGIDSVIPEASGFPVTAEFLAEMNTHWF